MEHWKVFYENEVYNSDDHVWEELHDDGIVSVVVFQGFVPESNPRRRYRRIADGFDWYFFYQDTLICNNDTLEQNKKRYPEATHFKRGKWVSDKRFKEISKLAQQSRWHDESSEDEPCTTC